LGRKAAQLGQETRVNIYRQEVRPPPHKRPNPPNTRSSWSPNTIDSLTSGLASGVSGVVTLVGQGQVASPFTCFWKPIKTNQPIRLSIVPDRPTNHD
jgi:hypothetical protein